MVGVIAGAIASAALTDLSELAEHFPLEEDRSYILRWPGEHYRLLHGFGQVLNPDLVVEVGTYRGASALVLSEVASSVVTYDVVGIDDQPDAPVEAFKQAANVGQRLGDLKDRAYFQSQAELLGAADMIFVDGPKDGVFEQSFVPKLLMIAKPGAFILLDDVRFRCMRSLWQGLDAARIDVGAFGHASGTGVIFVGRQPG
jgi:predicted O-methyltransferase YrrM